MRPREVWSWAMYDFANSGYTTVVITAVFNAYFVAEVAGNAPWATFAWTCALAVSYVLIIVTAPLVGAYADAHAAKKKLLVATTLGCIGFTAALALVGKGDLWLAVALIIVSNFFFGTGENLIAAFLPELADGEGMGRVSGWGWSLGYLGGLVSLGLCLAYVSWAQARGLSASGFVPVTMLITATLFAAASVPMFLFLRERARPVPYAGGIAAQSIARLKETIRHAARYADLRRFLVCLVFYQAGIQAVVALAAIYAQQVMGFTTKDTLSVDPRRQRDGGRRRLPFRPGAGPHRSRANDRADVDRLDRRDRARVARRRPCAFWIAANVVGVCLGSSQSAGRALVGYLSPPSRSAEFFGLWGLAVKLSSVLGPITYGFVTWVSDGDHRLAILLTGTYFLIGMIIVAGVDVQRGRSAALA